MFGGLRGAYTRATVPLPISDTKLKLLTSVVW